MRGAVDAVKEVHRLICRGYSDVVDADLSRYFDSIPHDELLKSVARRIVDRHVLRLIKLWLKAPIEEWDKGNGTRRIGGGKSNTRGTPQGGVASPLLANIYMNRFLKYWRLTGRGEAFRAHVISPGFLFASRSELPLGFDLVDVAGRAGRHAEPAMGFDAHLDHMDGVVAARISRQRAVKGIGDEIADRSLAASRPAPEPDGPWHTVERAARGVGIVRRSGCRRSRVHWGDAKHRARGR